MDQPIRLDRVKAERIRWLDTPSAPERFPVGMISVVAGRADQGKGLLAALIAAEVSQYGRVLYSAAEDSHGQMTRPRLEAAGVNMKNCLLWRFKLPKQWIELANIIVKHEIKLVVMDPLASHLSGGITRTSDNIRQVTDPMEELLSAAGCSVIFVEHVLKGRGRDRDPLGMIGGTGSGLVAAARAAYLLGTDPQDPDRRVMACAKLNVREKPDALVYEMDTVESTKVGTVPKLVYDEELMGFNPMLMFTKPRGSIGRPPDKKAAAAQWLGDYLMMAGKPVPAAQIFEDAKQYNMSAKTVRRAAEDMHVIKTPKGGGPKVTWDLPDHVKKLLDYSEEEATTSELPDEPAPIGPADSWDEALNELLGQEKDREYDADEEDGDE